MIRNKKDYHHYLSADRVALGGPHGLIGWLTNDIWRFQRALRRYEYLRNTRPILAPIAKLALGRRARRLGFTIPPNVFGPGLAIAHYGTIVVSNSARVGSNCRLHVGVNIGTAAGHAAAAPSIGDNCYIGPGAKLFGDIVIGDNTVIGANAVVNRSFPGGNVTIAGVPARVISKKNSLGLLVMGDVKGSENQE